MSQALQSHRADAHRPSKKPLRCAVYTRVSTDAGLEQDFNSLDAQREASEAYIRSQAQEGWKLIKTAYDDGGFSGGSLDRPALQRLLEDVRSGSVDVIVVYKVDRLTRSLADFAKLVELFDRHEVSFVSVTQAFNTTTSMGRLTLNVLLSFAQFEREVTGERIRDKIAASKKKGIWMGGGVALGYRVENRKLVIVPEEAEAVRYIFRRYLEIGSLLGLLEDLRAKGITTKVKALSTGKTIGGIAFTKGPIAHFLKNRLYIGEVVHQGQSYPGEHEAIIDRDTFGAVQAKLEENRAHHSKLRAESNALLMGRLFDDAGNVMSPTHCNKKGVRYRYYLSRALVEGRKHEAGTVRRVAADEIEGTVLEAIRTLADSNHPPNEPLVSDRDRICATVHRVTIGKTNVAIALTPEAAGAMGQSVLDIPWSRRRPKPKRELILPEGADPNTRPMHAERRAKLLRTIALGRKWLDELISDSSTTPETIARREDRSVRSVMMIVSLAFLAPDLIEAAVAGRLPRGIGATRLMDLPADWSQQCQQLGLANPS